MVGEFQYRPRIIDSALRKKLRSMGAVIIEGSKRCGKTTTAEQVSCSVLSLDDPDTTDSNRMMSEIDPGRLLEGE